MVSATKHGLEVMKESATEVKRGLFKFFKQSTREEHLENIQREMEAYREKRKEREWDAEQERLDKKYRNRENARLRKAKSRARMRQVQIDSGERSPGGRKRKVSKYLRLKQD